ncbi:YgaP family membrane protein [Anoxybacillus ayderensis]|uniref:Inner membrane protein YgaP-like transmembrane domain-containing protein n=1 Tax=Anoxybacillus flavithermus TaxID=33934 RepID=A0A094JJ41_9BACL|nr:DUF2892 domain-containing protein [Anoxybacillus ayderensis]KFZ32571.1 hypothetical protein JS44_01595 [Anoxybacillus flavithermus]MBA2879281.1 hypothetical protein [Anoxybacillus ayderensis]MED0656990.1 DUF2892 domain-containing protein [Anoxybacillus ayderensis]MED0686532.1 DUF2892 domain-containing protein [Anoxybacillus ayderensis]OSX53335.1 hypothetical protein B7H16_12035 [Anoxybacillus ayderensis]
MKQNIGVINAMIRITFGFTMLAWATASLSRKPWRESYIWVIMLAAMKIAEGIVRFCPVMALFERYQCQCDHNDKNEKAIPIEPVNPS